MRWLDTALVCGGAAFAFRPRLRAFQRKRLRREEKRCRATALQKDDVRFAQDHEQVACARLLEQFVAHAEVGVHAADFDAQLAVVFQVQIDVRIEGEADDVEQVEADAAQGFLGRFLQQFGADRAVFGADADGDSFGVAVGVGELARGVQPFAGERFERVELQAFLLVARLDAGLAQVVEDHRAELVGTDHADGEAVFADRSFLLLLDGQTAMRREAFDGERAGDADLAVVLVGLVEQEFSVGVFGDGGGDLRASLPLLDVRVVGDRLERDVRHTLVDEALLNVAREIFRRVGQARFGRRPTIMDLS